MLLYNNTIMAMTQEVIDMIPKKKRGRPPTDKTPEEQRLRNIEKVKEWNKNNKDKTNEIRRRYYHRNKEAILQKSREKRARARAAELGIDINELINRAAE